VIIIDDASTDDSVPRVRQLISGRTDAELICRERNAGVIAAMNEALRLATTEYITFAAADDLVLPGMYEKSLGLLERHRQAAFCSAIAHVPLSSGETWVPLPPAYPCPSACFIAPARVAELLLRAETWHSGTTMVHRRAHVLAAGGFRPALRSYCDGFLYLVMALRHGACFIPEPLAVWHRDVRGYSSATSRDDQAMEQILHAADALMSTEFADLFPPKLRRRINRRLRFRALSARHGRILRLPLFCALRWHDLPIEVRSRLWKGKIAGAP
jgi:glycosyltransferase involved in cell wall biosynthesis